MIGMPRSSNVALAATTETGTQRLIRHILRVGPTDVPRPKANFEVSASERRGRSVLAPHGARRQKGTRLSISDLLRR